MYVNFEKNNKSYYSIKASERIFIYTGDYYTIKIKDIKTFIYT